MVKYSALATSARPGWAKSSSDSDPWIQVDFKTTHLVVAIATWGRLYGRAQYVTAYTVSYSMDSEVWQMITEDGAMKVMSINKYIELNLMNMLQIFPGNSDRNTKVENSLSEQIQARLVRLHPKEYQNYPTMRWDVMVCKSGESILAQIELDPTKLLQHSQVTHEYLCCTAFSAEWCTMNATLYRRHTQLIRQ